MKKLLLSKKNKSLGVSVIGLGYVGLPLLLSFEKKKLINLIGIDNDIEKINLLKKGNSYISDLKNLKKKSKIIYTNKIDYIKYSDYIIICLPTPLKRNKVPDLSIVIDSLNTMVPYLKKGHSIILESTTYPGTTDEVIRPIIEKSGFIVGRDVFLSFSPERINPGSKFPIEEIPKIIGADDTKSLNSSKKLYKMVFKEIYSTNSSSVAEATKLTENIFRAVNIALVNELKIIYQKMNIDIWEVIKLAKTKPFGFTAFYPGPGLGGHCIPIDPFYLTWKARQYGINTEFIKLAGKINSSMPLYVIKNIIKVARSRLKIKLTNLKILIIGVAYKKNTNDLRESPGINIIKKLKDLNIIVNFHDPYVDQINNMRNYPDLSGKKSIALSKKNIENSDIVVIVTDHNNIKYDLIEKYSKFIIDTRNIINKNKINGVVIKS